MSTAAKPLIGMSGRLGQSAGSVRDEQAPETWQAPLMAELADTGADRNRQSNVFRVLPGGWHEA